MATASIPVACRSLSAPSAAAFGQKIGACDSSCAILRDFSNVGLRRVLRSATRALPVPSAVPSTHCQRATISPVANWKQEILWTDVPVSSSEKAAEGLFSVSLDISQNVELQEGYTLPGQFVQVKIGESKPAFLAIASPPKVALSGGSLEFLIKDVPGSTASLICQLSAGDAVQVSQVMGKGFAISQLSPPEEYSTVLIFATGSGISPIRALIEHSFDADKRNDVRLYYGARDLAHMAYQDRFPAWSSSGVTLIPVLSSPKDAAWEGETGFVQEAFVRQGGADASAAPRTGAVLCGHKGMAEDVTTILTEAGVPKEKILMNF